MGRGNNGEQLVINVMKTEGSSWVEEGDKQSREKCQQNEMMHMCEIFN